MKKGILNIYSVKMLAHAVLLSSSLLSNGYAMNLNAHEDMMRFQSIPSRQPATIEELRQVERAYYQANKALIDQLMLQDQGKLKQLRPVLDQIDQSTATFRSRSSRPWLIGKVSSLLRRTFHKN